MAWRYPKGHLWAWLLQTAWLAGAVGALKLAAGPCYMFISWLSSLKMNWAKTREELTPVGSS